MNLRASIYLASLDQRQQVKRVDFFDR